MLDAEQHNRRFLARVFSLAYLFLLLAAFGQRADMSQANILEDGQAIVADIHPGGLAQAILGSDNGYPDQLPAPGFSPAPAGLFSLQITNAIFLNQWKQHAQVPVVLPVKRYLLFACLRLGDIPPLA